MIDRGAWNGLVLRSASGRSAARRSHGRWWNPCSSARAACLAWRVQDAPEEEVEGDAEAQSPLPRSRLVRFCKRPDSRELLSREHMSSESVLLTIVPGLEPQLGQH
jgi:hypothetical protein